MQRAIAVFGVRDHVSVAHGHAAGAQRCTLVDTERSVQDRDGTVMRLDRVGSMVESGNERLAGALEHGGGLLVSVGEQIGDAYDGYAERHSITEPVGDVDVLVEVGERVERFAGAGGEVTGDCPRHAVLARRDAADHLACQGDGPVGFGIAQRQCRHREGFPHDVTVGELSSQCDDLLGMGERHRRLAPHRVHHRREPEDICQPHGLPLRASERQRLPCALAGLGGVALRQRDVGTHHREDEAGFTAQALLGIGGLVAAAPGEILVAPAEREERGHGERARVARMLGRSGEGEQGVARPARGGEQARLGEEIGRVPDAQQPEGDIEVAGVGGPRERSAEIVVLASESTLPFDPVAPHDVGNGQLAEARVVHGVGRAYPFAVAVLIEVLLGVLADGFQQPVARVDPLGVSDHQGTGDQCRHELEHIVGLDPAARGHGFGGLEIEPAREDAQPLQQQLLTLVEQLVRPVDGRPQRLVTLHGRVLAAGEQPEPRIETTRQLGRGEHRDARGRELDRQRDPVQPSTHLRHRIGVRRVEREARLHRLGPLHEEQHRGALRDRSQPRSVIGHV